MEHKKHSKRLLALLSVLLCVPLAFGVLTACGDDSGSDGGTGAQQGQQGGSGSGNEGSGSGNEGSGSGNEGTGNQGEGSGDQGEGDQGEGDQGGEQGDPTTVAQSAVKDEQSGLTYFRLDEVELLDAYAVNALDKEVDYLLLLDKDRLLADFRANAKLPAVEGKTAYPGGWEGALIGGHTLGHYLTALAQASVNAGTSAADKALLAERIDDILDVLQECQNNAVAAGAKEGFLWGAKVINSSKPEIQFDNLEATKLKADINTEAWVPWYTMHKILAGLLDVYTIAGNTQALEIATKLGSWVYDRVSKWSSATQRQVLSIEYGGMNDALYNLYAVTGEEKFAVAAHKFDEQGLIDSITNGAKDYLNELHANTTIPKVIGLLNGYIQLKAKPVSGIDTSKYLTVARRFWDDVVEKHTYVTGGNSEWEHFGRDNVLDRERTRCNCETCNTYNMLKLSRMIFSNLTSNKTSSGAKKYLDFYEGTYYNAIWSSQNPETGMTMYFQPMASGYFKAYSTPEENFWCCTGSGMESMSKLNDSIYYSAGNAVYVSLYLKSTLKTSSVSLTQTADLENSDTVTIAVDDGATTLRLRRPSWTTDHFAVKLNGKEVAIDQNNKTDSFVSVDVKKGDTVTVEMKKEITVYTLPDNADTTKKTTAYAFKYGPFVLSAELGSEDMSSFGSEGVSVRVPATAVRVPDVEIAADTDGGSVLTYLENINEHLVRGSDGKFTLGGTTAEMPFVLSYHFRQYQQRYAIYLRFADNGNAGTPDAWSWVEQDKVQPGYGQNESDDKHAFSEQGNGSVGESGVATRYAKSGGSFSYRIEVDPSTDNRLVLGVLGADKGKTLLVRAADTTLYSGTLTQTVDTTITVDIPSEVAATAVDTEIAGETYKLLTVTFSAVGNEDSARLSGSVTSLKHAYDASLDAKLRDPKIAYFVNCGDVDVYTLGADEKFGTLNTVTDQVYGADPVTGKMWGIVDVYNWTWSTQASYSGNYDKNAQPNGGVASKSTWALEGQTDAAEKTVTMRYTKNHFECGLTPKLSYKFELANGDYTVKMYFRDIWDCTSNPTVSANDAQKISNGQLEKELSFDVNVTGGELTLAISTTDKCIALCYIVIEFA